MTNDLVIGMAGAGGDGVVSAGESLIAAAAEIGYHAILTKSFGPQIRGGESSCRLRLSTAPVLNPGAPLDVAVALNWDDFLRFGAELPVGGGTLVVYDSASGVAPDRLPLAGVRPYFFFSLYSFSQAASISFACGFSFCARSHSPRSLYVLAPFLGIFSLWQ